MNTKSVALMVVAVLLLGGLVWYGILKSKTPSQVTSTNLKTYNNTEANVSFSYPEDWTVIASYGYDRAACDDPAYRAKNNDCTKFFQADISKNPIGAFSINYQACTHSFQIGSGPNEICYDLSLPEQIRTTYSGISTNGDLLKYVPEEALNAINIVRDSFRQQ